MMNVKKYEGHLTGDEDGQTWCWSNRMLKNTVTKAQMDATAWVLNDAPLLLAEVKHLREVIHEMKRDITAQEAGEQE